MAVAEKVLIVDDSPDDAELVVRVLRRAGHDIEFDRVETADTMLAALRGNQFQRAFPPLRRLGSVHI